MSAGEVDLAVVGAGPAGSAAALRALQCDPRLRVVLLDRAEFPRDKTCGDGVGPDGVDVLRRLGVVDEVLDGHPPIGRVAVRSPTGRVAAGTAPRPGHVVPRRVLDDRLRTAAIARGARAERRRVGDVVVDRDGVTLDGELRARWVVAADGAHSTIRRLLGVRPPSRRRTGLAIRAYAHAPDHDALTIRFEPTHWPAYAWIFPLQDPGRPPGWANVGYGPFDSTTVGSRADLLEGLHRALPDVEVDPSTLRAHHLPLSTDRRRPVHGRVLFAGDAANLVHPLTGEGIYYGLLSGATAGAAVARFPEAADRAYLGAMRHRLGRHLRHTAFAAALFRRQEPVELSVAAAASNARVLDDLCEFALASGLITPSMLRGLARRALAARSTGSPA